MPAAGGTRPYRQRGLQALLARHRSLAARVHYSRDCQAVHRRADLLHD